MVLLLHYSNPNVFVSEWPHIWLILVHFGFLYNCYQIIFLRILIVSSRLKLIKVFCGFMLFISSNKFNEDSIIVLKFSTNSIFRFVKWKNEILPNRNIIFFNHFYLSIEQLYNKLLTFKIKNKTNRKNQKTVFLFFFFNIFSLKYVSTNYTT